MSRSVTIDCEYVMPQLAAAYLREDVVRVHHADVAEHLAHFHAVHFFLGNLSARVFLEVDAAI